MHNGKNKRDEFLLFILFIYKKYEVDYFFSHIFLYKIKPFKNLLVSLFFSLNLLVQFSYVWNIELFYQCLIQ